MHEQEKEPALCSKMIVQTEPIAFEPVGMPLTSVGATAQLLLAALQQEVAKGSWERVKAESPRKPKPTCTTSASAAIPQLYLSDLIGAFFLLFVVILIGLGCTFCSLRRERNRRRKAAKAHVKVRCASWRQRARRSSNSSTATVVPAKPDERAAAEADSVLPFEDSES